MKLPRSTRRAVALLLTCALVASVLFAQQPKVATTPPNAAPQEATASSVTLDTLFASDSYAIYGEMRNVGQFVSSEEINQMLEPLHLPGMIPAEATDLLDFIRAHDETLASARIAFGAMPVQDGLPDVVAAIEMSSAEDAQKLEPQIREFIADYHAAHPDVIGAADANKPDAVKTGATRTTATRGASSTVASEGARRRAQAQTTQNTRAGEHTAGAKTAAEESAPIFIKRSGALLAMADRQFTFKKLRGGTAASDAQLLTNAPGFQAARAQFSRDTLFLYFNTTLISRSMKRKMDEEERQQKELLAMTADIHPVPLDPSASSMNSNVARSRAAATVGNANITVTNTNSVESNSNASRPTIVVEQTPDPSEMSPQERAEIEAEMAKAKEEQAKAVAEEEAKRKASPEYAEQRRKEEQQREFQQQLGQVMYGGGATGGTWAESIGVGLSLENDELVARSLFINDSPDRPLRPVPFIPILLSGPQIAPEASSVLPADADIFVSASLDLPQMYDYVASVFRIFDMAAQASGEQDKQGLFESQVTAFEKENKFRIKEDLLNALGNEIAVCLPADFLGVRRAGAVVATEGDEKSGEARAVQSSPVVVISLNDKKAVQDLLPRALEALGAKGVSEQMLIEKRGDVEMLTFSNGCAAFIDRFLVVALDPATMRWVVDAYNKRETLANNEEFRRAVGWQPRAALGQVYVSNALLKETFADVHNSVADIEDHELRNFISRLDPNPGAVTHVVTREGDGLLHELHVPKNLLALMSASAVVAEKTAPIRAKESAAVSALYSIAGAQEKFKEENGRYATQSELEAELKSERGGDGGTSSAFKVPDYEIKLNVSGDEFSVTATPTNYPKQGRRSFYIDQTMTMRGGDTGGKTATASSKPIS
jgi:hypothetical protein